jgi:DNA-binding GntR family transcriptional regulator
MSGEQRPTVGVLHLPLRAAVLDELRRSIVSGRFQPGERLLEDQLAQELDVSRNPVREALQALALEGFVELEPRRGARVATVSPKRAGELFEVRESLEGLVARLAATRRTDAQLAELATLVATGSAAVDAGRLVDLPDLNTQFHESLSAAANNDLLAEQLHRMRYLIEWVYSWRVRERSGRSWSEHAGIVEAIAAGDERTAFARACAHIANARAAYFDGAEPP